jgi:hypothetical protein
MKFDWLKIFRKVVQYSTEDIFSVNRQIKNVNFQGIDDENCFYS